MNKNLLKIIVAIVVTAIIAMLVYCYYQYNNNMNINAKKEVNVYTYRQPFLMKKVVNEFESQYKNVKINMVYMKKGLIKKILIEGDKTPADVVLLKGYSNIKKIVDANMLAQLNFDGIEKINPSYIGENNDWVAITARSRVMYVSNELKKLNFVKNYQDLADKRLKGKICIRDLSHSYNKELVAYYAAVYGQDAATKWFKGLVANLAKKPSGNDRAQVKFVYQGKCDVAVANDYYYLKMKNNDEQKKWLKKVDLIWPNQNENGTQLNITVAGVVKYSDNLDAAQQFVKFLTSKKAQDIFTNDNGEISIINPDNINTKERLSWSKSLILDKIKIDNKTQLKDAVNNIEFAEKLIDTVK